MARTKRNFEVQGQKRESAIWRTALYARLSRDDGDKPESDSIANQRKLLERFLAGQAQMELVGFYSDGPVKIGLNQKHPTARGALV